MKSETRLRPALPRIIVAIGFPFRRAVPLPPWLRIVLSRFRRDLFFEFPYDRRISGLRRFLLKRHFIGETLPRPSRGLLITGAAARSATVCLQTVTARA